MRTKIPAKQAAVRVARAVHRPIVRAVHKAAARAAVRAAHRKVPAVRVSPKTGRRNLIHSKI